MHLRIAPDAVTANVWAAEALTAEVRANPRVILGLPTGGTGVDVYTQWVPMLRSTGLTLSGVTVFNLDEYYPMEPTHPQSYTRYMEEHLFQFFPPGRRSIPDGLAGDPDAEAARYEHEIAAARGLDCVFISVGHNGHIAFNEPTDTFQTWTRRVDLTDETRQANARFFARLADVPRSAITVGIRTILSALRILLVVTGSGKAPAVRAMLEGPLTPQMPASVLRLHPQVQVVLDEAAAAELAPGVRDILSRR